MTRFFVCLLVVLLLVASLLAKGTGTSAFVTECTANGVNVTGTTSDIHSRFDLSLSFTNQSPILFETKPDAAGNLGWSFSLLSSGPYTIQVFERVGKGLTPVSPVYSCN